MKWEIIAAYLKGFSKYIRIALSILEYLFSLGSDDAVNCANKIVKY